MEGRSTSASTLNADPPQVIKMNKTRKVIEMIEGYRYLTHEELHDGEFIVMFLRRMTDDEEAIGSED